MEEFDYVIVGGGTAGCVLANRLTEQSNRTVLVLEAGERDNGFWIPIPAGFSKLLVNPRFNWKFETEPEENVYGRKIVVPRGKGLGGSTLINGMIFVRGQSQDFDHWAQLGNTGWSFEDILPYFKKLESYPSGDHELRGHDGPFHIKQVAERPRLAEAFVGAAREDGWPTNPDYNGHHQDGFGYYQVNQRNGRRWSAADAYLHPVEARPNLSVRIRAHAKRIDFDGRRAVGVTYVQGGRDVSVRARGEVILAAGSVQSPHLMELSGIGDPNVLASVGIPVKHALPGVGNNYLDHFCTRMSWRVRQPITLNEQTRGWRLGAAVAQYFLTRSGILTLGTGLAHGFVKTRPGLETPDVQYFFMHASYANAADRKLDRRPGMTIGVTQLRPESRGSIHLKSADPMSAPAIRPNFLSAAIDRETIVAGMQIARRIVERPAMNAYRDLEISPGRDVQTDQEWLEFARRTGQTIYHAIGTCSMGGGADAVVSPHLMVHGLERLRIVDASIMPSMISGNTAAAVLMIAERAADLIKASEKVR